MQLVALDTLVASWVLQLGLGGVFLTAIWGMAYAFRRRAVAALAGGWTLYLLYMMASLAFAVAARSNPNESAHSVLGMLEGLGLIGMFTFWQPTAAVLAGTRQNAMPSVRSLLACAAFAGTLMVVSLGLKRDLLTPGSGPLKYLYPASFTWLAVSAWRMRRHTQTNRLELLCLALGFLTFAARVEVTRDVVLRSVDYAHASSFRLLVVAVIQVVQVVSFGVICLIVALAIERSAILRQSHRLRHAEVRLAKSRRLESLGEMAARVAHDFNNILSVIAMSADLASDAKADPAAVESELAAVTHATRRAGELVRQLLVFANPRTPAAQVAPALDVNAYLASSAHMLRRLMGDRVALDIAGVESEAWILMDPSQFEQVVMNLVVNARDAMPTGGVIRVETAMVELTTAHVLFEGELPAGSYLRTSVQDSGGGIAAHVLPRIFDPFFTTKGDEGTGLGLATVYNIVHHARGDVAVHSEIGCGTRFDVYLPLTSKPNGKAA